MIASVVLAFGLWIIAVLQSDPVQERDFPRRQTIEFVADENMIVTNESGIDAVLVKVRAPRSVWDSLRDDDIVVVADLRGETPQNGRVTLEAHLANNLRGQVIELTPSQIEVRLEEIATRRLPIQVLVVQDPPSGYAAAPPECALTEVTAQGAAEKLNDATALARLDLSQERNPVTLQAALSAVDGRGRLLAGIDLEPERIECTVQITQREGVSELSVIPDVKGFPPTGYIYEGYEFEPQTVVVTGSPNAIRELNGVVSTESIDLTDTTGDFERAVGVVLPSDIRLLPATQTITVRVKIGTVPSTRQYENIAIQVEGLGSGLDAQLLPATVTVFAVGPQPLLESLPQGDLRVAVDLSNLGEGSYQAIPSIDTENLPPEITLTVQPAEISVTLITLDTR